MNLWDFEKHADRIVVLEEDGKTYRYSDIDVLQKQLAEKIQNRSLVGLFVENDLGGLIGYVSCLKNDFVPIMLPTPKENAGVWQILKEYTPNYLWIAKQYLQEIDKEMAMEYQEKFCFFDYVLLERIQNRCVALHPELALLLPTSGSTGSPKLVRISRKNIRANTESICKYMKLTKEERAITSLPMSYTYGLSVINTHLYMGGSILLTKAKVLQRRFWELMKLHKITFLAGVPHTYEVMKKIGVADFELPSLRMLTQAGGKLSVPLQQFWGEYAHKLEKEFLVMYGQTEATARISYLPTEDCLRKLGSVGIAIPDCEITIVDDDGVQICEFGKIGEVVCAGEQVSMGYGECVEDFAKGDENHHILHTGDLGYLDEEGYLMITGRSNRFAKIMGKRLDLSYLERKAESYLGESVVVISNDKKIFLFTDAEVSEEVLKQMMEDVGVRVNIFEIRKSESLPRTNSGKIDYKGENLQ